MAAQGAGSAKTKKDTRTGCGCLAFIVVVVVIVIAVASGSGGKGSSPEKEAREYISQKSHVINYGRVDYEHVEALVGLATKAGNESSTVIDELAKVAQEAHNEIEGFRQELFKSGGNEKLSTATLELQEGANELKNAMGGLVAYTGNPNPATLAHFTTQLEAAKSKWNGGAEAIWGIAKESGAMTLK
jgi:pyrroloquinoline quinone (PQQ) biosynthesis protein C